MAAGDSFSGSALASSARNTWRTPPDALALVSACFGGRIDLDPCAARHRAHRFAVTSWSAGGLDNPWQTHGAPVRRIYVNPPYGREIGAWINQCIAAGRAGARVLALVPARTDTQWFQAAALTASRIGFITGRLTFVGAPAPAPFPSAFILWDATRAGRAAFDRVMQDHALIARFGAESTD